ncbi:MAG: hypothetical protein HDR23_08480 [Lachnospiraceae bacterium]|nr:hypothetical protein [Lachnospiraceae bacterium]MBD5456485.1 hypothetical protein [Lachnospiraceae bacterium]
MVNGESITKKIRQELTYRDLDSQIDNLWSILFTTGYLTKCGEDDGMTIIRKYGTACYKKRCRVIAG